MELNRPLLSPTQLKTQRPLEHPYLSPHPLRFHLAPRHSPIPPPSYSPWHSMAAKTFPPPPPRIRNAAFLHFCPPFPPPPFLYRVTLSTNGQDTRHSSASSTARPCVGDLTLCEERKKSPDPTGRVVELGLGRIRVHTSRFRRWRTGDEGVRGGVGWGGVGNVFFSPRPLPGGGVGGYGGNTTERLRADGAWGRFAE